MAVSKNAIVLVAFAVILVLTYLGYSEYQRRQRDREDRIIELLEGIEEQNRKEVTDVDSKQVDLNLKRLATIMRPSDEFACDKLLVLRKDFSNSAKERMRAANQLENIIKPTRPGAFDVLKEKIEERILGPKPLPEEQQKVLEEARDYKSASVEYENMAKMVESVAAEVCLPRRSYESKSQ